MGKENAQQSRRREKLMTNSLVPYVRTEAFIDGLLLERVKLLYYAICFALR